MLILGRSVAITDLIMMQAVLS